MGNGDILESIISRLALRQRRKERAKKSKTAALNAARSNLSAVIGEVNVGDEKIYDSKALQPLSESLARSLMTYSASASFSEDMKALEKMLSSIEKQSLVVCKA